MVCVTWIATLKYLFVGLYAMLHNSVLTKKNQTIQSLGVDLSVPIRPQAAKHLDTAGWEACHLPSQQAVDT